MKSDLRKIRVNAGRVAKRFPDNAAVQSLTDIMRGQVRAMRRDPSRVPAVMPFMQSTALQLDFTLTHLTPAGT